MAVERAKTRRSRRRRRRPPFRVRHHRRYRHRARTGTVERPVENRRGGRRRLCNVRRRIRRPPARPRRRRSRRRRNRDRGKRTSIVATRPTSSAKRGIGGCISCLRRHRSRHPTTPVISGARASLRPRGGARGVDSHRYRELRPVRRDANWFCTTRPHPSYTSCCPGRVTTAGTSPSACTG
jgi:hypothetical protein